MNRVREVRLTVRLCVLVLVAATVPACRSAEAPPTVVAEAVSSDARRMFQDRESIERAILHCELAIKHTLLPGTAAQEKAQRQLEVLREALCELESAGHE